MPCHAQPNPSAGERFERACVPQAGQCRGSDRGGPPAQVPQALVPHPCPPCRKGNREKGPRDSPGPPSAVEGPDHAQWPDPRRSHLFLVEDHLSSVLDPEDGPVRPAS